MSSKSRAAKAKTKVKAKKTRARTGGGTSDNQEDEDEDDEDDYEKEKKQENQTKQIVLQVMGRAVRLLSDSKMTFATEILHRLSEFIVKYSNFGVDTSLNLWLSVAGKKSNWTALFTKQVTEAIRDMEYFWDNETDKIVQNWLWVASHSTVSKDQDVLLREETESFARRLATVKQHDLVLLPIRTLVDKLRKALSSSTTKDMKVNENIALQTTEAIRKAQAEELQPKKAASIWFDSIETEMKQIQTHGLDEYIRQKIENEALSTVEYGYQLNRFYLDLYVQPSTQKIPGAFEYKKVRQVIQFPSGDWFSFLFQVPATAARTVAKLGKVIGPKKILSWASSALAWNPYSTEGYAVLSALLLLDSGWDYIHTLDSSSFSYTRHPAGGSFLATIPTHINGQPVLDAKDEETRQADVFKRRTVILEKLKSTLNKTVLTGLLKNLGKEMGVGGLADGIALLLTHGPTVKQVYDSDVLWSFLNAVHHEVKTTFTGGDVSNTKTILRQAEHERQLNQALATLAKSKHVASFKEEEEETKQIETYRTVLNSKGTHEYRDLIRELQEQKKTLSPKDKRQELQSIVASYLSNLGFKDEVARKFFERTNQFEAIFKNLLKNTDIVSSGSALTQLAVLAARDTGIFRTLWNQTSEALPAPVPLQYNEEVVIVSGAKKLDEDLVFLYTLSRLAIFSNAIYATSRREFVLKAEGFIGQSTSPVEERKKKSKSFAFLRHVLDRKNAWLSNDREPLLLSRKKEQQQIDEPDEEDNDDDEVTETESEEEQQDEKEEDRKQYRPTVTVLDFQKQEQGKTRLQFGIVYDELLRALVVVIRGTASMGDALTDVSMTPRECIFQSPWNTDAVKGFVHDGFFSEALAVSEEIIGKISRLVSKKAIKTFNTKKGIKTLVFTGHSLGAAVSGLLTLMFNNRFGLDGNKEKKKTVAEELEMDCFGVGFATPASMSYELAHHLAPFFQSMVLSNDIVPRLNAYALYRLGVRKQILEPCSFSTSTGECADFTDSKTCRTFIPFTVPGTIQFAIYEYHGTSSQASSIKPDTIDTVVTQKLYPTHPVFFLDRLEFQENALTDHSMDRYLHFVRSLYLTHSDTYAKQTKSPTDVYALLMSEHQCLHFKPLFWKNALPLSTRNFNSKCDKEYTLSPSVLLAPLENLVKMEREIQLRRLFKSRTPCHVDHSSSSSSSSSSIEVHNDLSNDDPREFMRMFSTESPLLGYAQRSLQQLALYKTEIQATVSIMNKQEENDVKEIDKYMERAAGLIKLLTI